MLTEYERYIEDCGKTGVQPSFFQIMRFLWDVQGPMAIPVPYLPASVGIAVSKYFCWFNGAVIGGWLLGYKASYDEYYSETLVDV